MDAQGPRVAICFYSATGNTKLACEYVARHLPQEVTLFDVTDGHPVDLEGFDVIGLAAPTDFGGVPQRFIDFVTWLEPLQPAPAFVLNTFGFMSQLTLPALADAATSRGYRVIGSHSLRMPENYPPMILVGMGGAHSLPRPKDMRGFDAFIADLGGRIGTAADPAVAEQPVRRGFLDSLARPQSRTKARADMGEKRVDLAACTRCGTCARGCPYEAIVLDPTPRFDMRRCYGCWRCYNRCPQRAISTARFEGTPFYPHPSQHARTVLGG